LTSRKRIPNTGSRAQTAHEREIARLQIRLMRASARDERREILEKLFEEEQGLSGTKLSSIPRQLGRGQPIELSKLQQMLRPDELIVEYALASPRSHCLLIDKNEIRAIALPDRDRIEALVDRYLAQVRSKKSAQEPARELYSVLLESLTKDTQARYLIVVPDGKLHLLPFDALVDRRGDYVLGRSVVTYSPSATVLHLLRTQPENAATDVPLLAIGDVPYQDVGNLIAASGGRAKTVPVGTTRGLYDLKGERLPPLAGTAEEVTSIANIAGPKAIVLMGLKATEAALRSQPLERIRVLHIAVHGISSSTSPERAALVLARGTKDENDGLLQAREISDMHLAADLVTLSACDTGAGRLVGQEGIVNLVRAFLFAGAKSVVASLWAADDIFTTSLMKRFYSNLAKGMDRGVALQKAKLDLIEQFGDDAVPFYWAGFTLVGDGSRQIKFSE
jgi:CHAT domain-containing protein